MQKTSTLKRQELFEAAEAQAVVHDILSHMPLTQGLDAVLAHLEAQDLTPVQADKLMTFSNRVGRIAWAHV